VIYWELHNPRFEVRLASPLGYDVWSWNRGEGWVDYLDVEEFFVFSEPFFLDEVSRAVRERLIAGPPHPDSLVLYYTDEDRVRVSLVGALDTQLLQGLNVVPPDWWSSLEGTPPMQRMLERVRILIGTFTGRDPWKTSTRHLQAKVPGYCSVCGLPEACHVSHEVPGFPKEVVSTLRTPEAARPYYLAFRAHYGNALKRMTEAELLAMPLPPSRRHLKVLELDLKRRLSEPPPVPASAVERLLTRPLLGD
jgi:hypothetical protein